VPQRIHQDEIALVLAGSVSSRGRRFYNTYTGWEQQRAHAVDTPRGSLALVRSVSCRSATRVEEASA
jgi:hypothetical protein